jgi:GxxExxY protein
MDELTGKIIGAAIEVHKAMGPGLLESVYVDCLCHELALRKLAFRRQVELPIQYKGTKLACNLRLDLLVEEAVPVEVKAVEQVLPVHEAQLLSYLKLGGWTAGLLINFNVPALKDGIKRVVHGFRGR